MKMPFITKENGVLNKKLIDELKQQSQTVVGEGLGGNYYELDPDKFAELLIRKCAQLAGEAEENEHEGRSTYFVVLEHFGLE